MISTPTRGIGRSRKVLMLLAGLAVAMAGTLAFAGGQAKAEPFQMKFTNSQLNLGFAFKKKPILPAPQSIGDTPLPDLWDIRATQSTPGTGTPPNSLTSFKPLGCATPTTYRIVSPGPPPDAQPNDGNGGRPLTPNPDYPCDPNPADATVTGDVTSEGDVTIQASDFRFPIMTVPNPTDPTAIVPLTLAATGELTGEYDAVEGTLDLNGPLEARVLVGLGTAGTLSTYCAVKLSEAGLQLNTGVSTPANVGFAGTPFNSPEGLEGDGAVAGTWNNPAVESFGGYNCATVEGVTGGLGGIWLGAGIETPAPYPTCEAEGKVGTWPECKTPASISSVKVTPTSKTVKGGTKVKLSVKVSNSGEESTTANVSLKSSNKSLATVPGSVSMTVAGGSSATKSVTVTTKKGKKGKVTITASTSGKSGKSTITLKK